VCAADKLYLASSNPGKLAEFRALVESDSQHPVVSIESLPDIASLPEFDESAPTFAENAAGKALHYSRLSDGLIFADDSGLVVPALGGDPGVRSARYAGPGATSEDRIAKVLAELKRRSGEDRRAHFVCAIALAQRGSISAVVSGRVDGQLLDASRGSGGFGYDPVFYVPERNQTFAELSQREKNEISHRGNAFHRLLAFLISWPGPQKLDHS
jgi:non-canonical purine NTP pyrophosphatase (RdgB/HAM1 family)